MKEVRSELAMRSYNQACGLAVALDLIGDRWTLLIIRELLVRPSRFAELQQNLIGANTNLLSDRLARLRSDGIIDVTVDPDDARSRRYELTERGGELREAVLALSRWGLESGGRHDGDVRASWAQLAIEAMVRPGQSGHKDAVYRFEVGDTAFVLEAVDGVTKVAAESDSTADVTFVTDPETFMSLGFGDLDPVEAIRDGHVSVHGSEHLVMQAAELLGLTAR